MSQVDRSFIGEGIPYARAYQSQDSLLDMGNCDAFNIAFTNNRQTLPNFRGGGGNRNVRERVTDVTATIGLYDMPETNLARITRSTVQAIAAGIVTDEPATSGGVQGELIPFKYLPDLTAEVTVKTAAGEPLVAGNDYLLTPHGLLRTAISDIDATGVLLTYTKRASSALQLLNGSPVELEIVIAGLNDAQSGEPYSLHLRRVKFGMLASLPVFGQEYLKLEGPAELLADPLVLSNDISKFCQMDIVSKAA
ncbi:hypothetical protein [Phytopseudomonas seleniipraecipitans]|uniref:Uncharacterized protein n=1 Tax=Phytopseudomonas seleniipraecipitans TaxID=640205 RepID=A0A1G7JC36_9GAMM|nr:hypothetical protein [Pseudomonas seleniipraecipitans]SDF22465.1 hypothetical protein SAMN05216381_1064 [Pseudomonas seleniipraecipitans]